MKVAIVTGVYGGYDPVRALPADHGFDDAVCVTDDETLEAPGWRIVVRPSPLPERLACKYPKMMPWKFVDTDAAVWLDASFSVNGGGLNEFVRPQLEANDFIVFKHPETRTCITQEMSLCRGWLKYRDWPLRAQVRHYMDAGMPVDFGLWAAGMVGWRFTDHAKDFGRRWHIENTAWSIQDQISLPFLLWQQRRVPGEWDCHEFNNPYITYHGHTRQD